MSNEIAIGQYCLYFEEQIEQILGLKDPLFRKILLVVVIDTLAHALCPDKNNKDRFVELIQKCAGWPDCNRVSLPQLLFRIEAIQVVPDTGLIKEVKTKLEKWQTGEIYRIDSDPWVDELKPLAQTENEQQLIDDSRHVMLLYIYRNHLVHEFREPGYGIELSDDSAMPYYHSSNLKNDESRVTWELVYSVSFLAGIAKPSLANLKRYLEDKDIDPYSLYEFGSHWKRR